MTIQLHTTDGHKPCVKGSEEDSARCWGVHSWHIHLEQSNGQLDFQQMSFDRK